MKLDELEHIVDELNAIFQNLKAETIVAELKKNSTISNNDFKVNHLSNFRRSHRRDITKVSLSEDHKIEFNLSRNGLYDYLPESVFHYPSSDKNIASFQQLRYTYKQEEKDARHFFSPLENEFFLQRLNIEFKEQELLSEFLNLDDQFLINFWDVDATIPRKYLVKLLRLIPFSYKIAGDLELTRICLEHIIDEKVTFRKDYSNKDLIVSEEQITNVLGFNFTLHSNKSQFSYPILDIIIGPIEINKLEYYIHKEGLNKFLNVFYEYFIPLEFNLNTKFEVSSESGITLNEEQQPVLGFSTQL